MGRPRLTTNTASDTTPSLSPDGTRIAFTNNRDGNNEIYMMNTDRTSATRLTNNPAGDDAPAYSLDGRIGFVRFENANRDVYLMNANVTDQTRLTNHLAVDLMPTFSPDGTKIAFTTDRSGDREINVTNTDDTSGALNLTDNPRSTTWRSGAHPGSDPGLPARRAHTSGLPGDHRNPGQRRPDRHGRSGHHLRLRR